MKIIIDRIEGTYAIAELPDGKTIKVPAALFPDAEEGDIYHIKKNKKAAETRQKRINEKMNRVFRD